MTLRPHDWPARLELDPTAWIAPGAVVVGAVRLGARSSIWFNTVVRGDSDRIEIGEDSNVQDNSTVHVDDGQPALVGARVTIGHRAIVHGCVIEDDCLIGMGSVVLSGARIGTGSLIGAASLVREGQVIPPGSLALGSPARVIGPVSETHREAIRRGTQHYVELSRGYLLRGFARPHPRRDSDTGINARATAPLGFVEWEHLLSVLAESPAWVERRLALDPGPRWSQTPEPGRWSAAEILGHMRDVDRDVLVPRIRLVLAGAHEVPDVKLEKRNPHGKGERDPSRILGEWREARSTLIELLRPVGPPEWGRVVFHPVRGPLPLGEMVRGLAEHDLSHRRQIAKALGDFAS